MHAFSLVHGLAGLLAASCAAAQQLQTINNFGSNPTGLTMQVHVPANLRPSPAVILALHGCGGNGQGYARQADYTTQASSRNYIVIYPSSRRDFNCWDVATPASLTHDGGGDSTGLANMIRHTLTAYVAAPARVFVTGTSSGCMMTNVMSAAYPDLAWAARARNMFPGYAGAYPRFQTLHGTADTLVRIPNLDQQLRQWAAVKGLSLTRNNTNTPQSGYTQIVYGDGTQLVGYSAQGVGHTVPVNVGLDLRWFGL
ncbi:Cys-Gly metallodipeptidase dug1 [Verticillium dahliae VDG2]|nr:Cys-Gly metallodipeptidase dug1 [Verticillium dahliae VDG2]